MLRMILPRTALAGSKRVFEIRIARSRIANRLDGLIGKRRTPEIRMDDDARRVDQRFQARRTLCYELCPEHLRVLIADQRRHVRAAVDELTANPAQVTAHHRDDLGMRVFGAQGPALLARQPRIDAWQCSQ